MVHDLARVDLTDLDTFAAGFPHDIFRLHREQAPVWWHEPTAHTPDGEGFWSVATYDEVRQVLNDPLTYSSETGGDRPCGGTIIQDLPVAGIVLNMMDDPRHARIRRLVTRGLTPAAVRDLERELRGRMRRLVESVGDDCDFLVDVAAELPMQAICLLLGVPEADRHLLFDAVEHIFDIPDESDFLSMTPEREAAVGVLYEYGAALIDEKRANPGPDMLSTVIHAELLDADPPSPRDPRRARGGAACHRFVHPCCAGAVDTQQSSHRHPPSPVALTQGDHNIGIGHRRVTWRTRIPMQFTG
jgi:cytochrome P450